MKLMETEWNLTAFLHIYLMNFRNCERFKLSFLLAISTTSNFRTKLEFSWNVAIDNIWNKRVLLRKRKRHAARRVASPWREGGLSFLAGGYPHLWMSEYPHHWMGGYPIQPLTGGTHPALNRGAPTWMGDTPIPEWGTSHPRLDGGTLLHPRLDGATPHPGGVPPIQNKLSTYQLWCKYVRNLDEWISELIPVIHIISCGPIYVNPVWNQ